MRRIQGCVGTDDNACPRGRSHQGKDLADLCQRNRVAHAVLIQADDHSCSRVQRKVLSNTFCQSCDVCRIPRRIIEPSQIRPRRPFYWQMYWLRWPLYWLHGSSAWRNRRRRRWHDAAWRRGSRGPDICRSLWSRSRRLRGVGRGFCLRNRPFNPQSR